MTQTLESDDLIVTLVDYPEDGVYFELTDKLSGESKMLGFDLRYW